MWRFCGLTGRFWVPSGLGYGYGRFLDLILDRCGYRTLVWFNGSMTCTDETTGTPTKRREVWVTLSQDKVSEDVWLGHVLDKMGGIPRNEEYANQIQNEDCLHDLRIAEAFAAGLAAGRAEARRG